MNLTFSSISALHSGSHACHFIIHVVWSLTKRHIIMPKLTILSEVYTSIHSNAERQTSFTHKTAKEEAWLTD